MKISGSLQRWLENKLDNMYNNKQTIQTLINTYLRFYNESLINNIYPKPDFISVIYNLYFLPKGASSIKNAINYPDQKILSIINNEIEKFYPLIRKKLECLD